MARSANQKLKLLYLAQYFHEMTDEEHPVSVAEIISYLGSLDIKAERKTIYDDIEALRMFGIDIVQVRGKTSGYYVGAREFELPELKLLVDSVQSSKFITQKKTLSLIKKIEALANRFDAQLLQRQVYVRNRVKSMNESVYYNVDEISAAITRDREIRFRYFEYDLKKERRFRKNGEFYTVSPFALMWDDENYYMLAWDKDAEMLKHYRVDKMTQISLCEAQRSGKDAFSAVDMSAYSKKVFGMFTGAETRVKLRFANHLIGPVIDRFGKDLFISPDGEEHFTVHLDVAVSPQFYAWVFGFGAEAEILAPESVRSEMKTRLSESRVLYE
ncbi:MAG: WYL domain-containing transcriptional regulator [Oscillospiraceae bacterium]|nr:WYL domain-containing transcriptional regulator [Oscillospiraceae bacterium]